MSSSSLYSPNSNQNTDSGAWLITFADLLSLMLTFFVLLYSMSTVTPHKYERITKSLQQRLNPDQIRVQTPTEENSQIASILKLYNVIGKDLGYLYGIISEKSSGTLADKIKVSHIDNRVIISLYTDALFAPGSDEPAKEGIETLRQISDIVSRFDNKIAVHGHSDPTPLRKSKYRSNWELSLARAQVAAKFIIESGYDSPIDVLGLADSRYHMIVEEQDTESTRTLARRVDIVVHDTLVDEK